MKDDINKTINEGPQITHNQGNQHTITISRFVYSFSVQCTALERRASQTQIKAIYCKATTDVDLDSDSENDFYTYNRLIFVVLFWQILHQYSGVHRLFCTFLTSERRISSINQIIHKNRLIVFRWPFGCLLARETELRRKCWYSILNGVFYISMQNHTESTYTPAKNDTIDKCHLIAKISTHLKFVIFKV